MTNIFYVFFFIFINENIYTICFLLYISDKHLLCIFHINITENRVKESEEIKLIEL